MSNQVEVIVEKPVVGKVSPPKTDDESWPELYRFGALFLILPVYLTLAVLYGVTVFQYRDELSPCGEETKHYLYFRTTFTWVMTTLALAYAVVAKLPTASRATAVTMGLIWVGGCCTWALIPSGCSIGDTFYGFDDLAGTTAAIAVEMDHWLHYITFIIGCIVLGLYCIGALLNDMCR